MKALTVISLLLTLVGCMNLTTRLQPEDQTIKAALIGSDCVPIVFGIGIGTADVEQARRAAYPSELVARWDGPPVNASAARPLARIRSVALTHEAFLAFGTWCVEVTGE